MENKVIMFTAPRKAEYLDAPMPEAVGDKVVVKLEVSSVSSGTERANVIGDTEIGTGKIPRCRSFRVFSVTARQVLLQPSARR